MIRFMVLILVMVVSSAAVARTYTASSIPMGCSVFKAYQPAEGVTIDNGFDFGIDVVRFPFTIDLAETFDLPVPTGTELEPDFGMIEVRKDGQIFYNDQNISAKIEEVCKTDG